MERMVDQGQDQAAESLARLELQVTMTIMPKTRTRAYFLCLMTITHPFTSPITHPSLAHLLTQPLPPPFVVQQQVADLEQQLVDAKKESLVATVRSEAVLVEKDSQLKMRLEEWENEKKANLEGWEKEKKGLDARVEELEHQLTEAEKAREEGLALVVAANDRFADAVATKDLGTTYPFIHPVINAFIYPIYSSCL